MRATPAALHVPELADEPGLVHGFSTVAIGSVGLKHATDRSAVLESRRKFAAVLGLDGAELTTIGSVHGAGVPESPAQWGPSTTSTRWSPTAPASRQIPRCLAKPYQDCFCPAVHALA